jgi:hypothetical protein
MSSPNNPYNLGLFPSGTYIPFICDIAGITNANPALITTTIDHDFVVGNEVQFFIPNDWGMTQLNNLTGNVLSVPTVTEFTVSIDTTFFNKFVTPTPPPFVVIDPAQVAGIGDVNTGQLAPGGVLPVPNTVPGAFQNIPPNENLI